MLLILAFGSACSASSTAAESRLTYLILADTVEPLMITTDSDPLAGGIVTDTLKTILEGTTYQLSALVVPWQRMTEEMIERKDWVMYGPPSRCAAERGCARSQMHIVEFEHVVVALSDSPLRVRSHEDLFGQRLLLVDNFHYPGLDRYLATPVDQPGSGDIEDIRAFTPEGALRMLRHRRGDAYIDWRLRVLHNLAGAGLARDDVRFSDATDIVPTQTIHFFFSNQLPAEFRNHVDEKLLQMHQDGSMKRIIERYQ